MRLLFLSNFFPPREIGGWEQACQEVADHLMRRGHSVEILTTRAPAGEAPAPTAGVRRALHLQADLEHYRPADFFTKRRRRERENLRAMRAALREFEPDVVMVWGMWNLSRRIARAAEQVIPGRVAYFVASHWPAEEDMHLRYWREPARRPATELLKKPLRALARRALAREGVPIELDFDHVRCVSRHLRDTLVGNGSLPPHSGVLYLGVDCDAFDVGAASHEDGPLRLLYCGSLLEHKGVHTLLEALARLDPGDGDVSLTIVGGGRSDYRRRLDSLVAEHDLADRVRFVGRVARASIPEWLGKADVFLFPSVWAEPMARSVMEAMAAGLVVIGTPVGGQREILRDGENSLTFPPGDPQALARQIERVRDDRALATRLARAGYERVRRDFTTTRLVSEIESWLACVADAPRGRAKDGAAPRLTS